MGPEGPQGPQGIEGPQCVMTAQQAGITSVVDLTGMTLALPVGRHRFQFQVIHRTSGVLVGAQFSLGFSGTGSGLQYTLTQYSSATSVVSAAGTLLDTMLGLTTGPGAVDVPAFFDGSLNVTVPGQLKVRAAAAGLLGGNITVQLGSNGGAFQA